MMKTLIISFFILFASTMAFAQISNDTIVVAPGVEGMYFYHIVQKEETLDHISKKFHTSKKQLIALNGNHPPKPYDVIKIPLAEENIIQTGSASDHQTLEPLYHKVLKGETLYRIGKMYGDIPLETLRSWNDLSGNNIGIGQYLVVGWLQNNPSEENRTSGTASAPDQSKKSENPPRYPGSYSQTKSSPTEKDDPFLKEVISSEKRRVILKSKEDEPVSRPLLTKSTSTPENNRPSVSKKEESSPPASQPLLTQQEEPAPKQHTTETKSTSAFEKMLNKITKITQKKGESASPPQPQSPKVPAVANKTATDKEEKINMPPPSPKLPNAPAPVAEKAQSAPPSEMQDMESNSEIQEEEEEDTKDTTSLELAAKSQFEELFFAQTQGEKLVVSEKGAAGWFKSNVKPGSKKYYALCNDLPRGTIVKVINPINKKFIYAKVLSSIPQGKKNYNLIIKLSDAAMDDLGSNQPRFWSMIVYPKTNNH